MSLARIPQLLILLLFLSISFASGINFLRNILSVEFPYYKILLSLGQCKARKIYHDSKVWGSVKMNRILDINYKSNDSTTVSRVEIKLVINNTDCISESDTGVGSTTFKAVLLLPMNVGVVFYDLTLFTCTKILADYEPNNMNQTIFTSAPKRPGNTDDDDDDYDDDGFE